MPSPPARRYIPAINEVSAREGVTVAVRRRGDIYCWAVHYVQPDGAIRVRTGYAEGEPTDPKPASLATDIEEAVLAMDAGGMPVFVVSEKTSNPLHDRTTVPVSDLAPAPGDSAAAWAAVDQAERALITGLVLTCDASVRRGHRDAGCGWILTYPHSLRPKVGAGVRTLSKITAAEIAAIRQGLIAATSRHTHLRMGRGSILIRSDSQNALALIKQVQDEPFAGPWLGSAAPEARAVAELLDGVKHRFEWVRGHAGDTGNEFADRLAVMARRHHEAGIDKPVRVQMTELIRGEAYGELSA